MVVGIGFLEMVTGSVAKYYRLSKGQGQKKKLVVGEQLEYVNIKLDQLETLDNEEFNLKQEVLCVDLIQATASIADIITNVISFLLGGVIGLAGGIVQQIVSNKFEIKNVKNRRIIDKLEELYLISIDLTQEIMQDMNSIILFLEKRDESILNKSSDFISKISKARMLADLYLSESKSIVRFESVIYNFKSVFDGGPKEILSQGKEFFKQKYLVVIEEHNKLCNDILVKTKKELHI